MDLHPRTGVWELPPPLPPPMLLSRPMSNRPGFSAVLGWAVHPQRTQQTQLHEPATARSSHARGSRCSPHHAQHGTPKATVPAARGSQAFLAPADPRRPPPTPADPARLPQASLWDNVIRSAACSGVLHAQESCMLRSAARQKPQRMTCGSCKSNPPTTASCCAATLHWPPPPPPTPFSSPCYNSAPLGLPLSCFQQGQ
jgi:hypothetical protein